MEPPDISVNPQVAEGKMGDIAQPAPVQGDIAQPAPVEPTTPVEPEKGPVPYDRFQEVIEQKRQAQEQVAQAHRLLEQQLMVHQAIARQQQAPVPPPSDPIAEYMTREGIGKDGYITPEDFVKAVQHVRQVSQLESQQQMYQQMQQQQFQQWLAAHSDYVGVVATPTGYASEYLQRALSKEPAIAMRLQQQWDPILAYALAKAEQAVQSVVPVPSPVQPNAAQQIRAAQRAPQSITVASGTGQLDKASHVAAMPPAEFAQAWENLKAGKGFVTTV